MLVFRALLVVALVGVVGVLMWASFRGVDWTDESLYLTGYLKGYGWQEGPYTYYSLYKELFSWTAPLGVGAIRLLGVTLLLGGAAVMGWGLAPVLKLPVIDAVLVSTCASLAYYSWTPLTPSYNTFAAAFLYAGAGMYALAHRAKRPAFRWLFSLAGGVSFGLGCLGKISVLLAMVVFVGGWLLLVERGGSALLRALTVIIIALCTFTGFLMISAGVSNPVEIVERLLSKTPYLHSLRDILYIYFYSTWSATLHWRWLLLGAVAGGIAVYIMSRFTSARISLSVVIILAAVLFKALQLYRPMHTYELPLLYLLPAIFAVSYTTASGKVFHRHTGATLVWLWLTVTGGIAGTNNPPYIYAITYMALLALPLLALAEASSHRSIIRVAVAFLCVSGAYQTGVRQVLTPYRMNIPLAKMNCLIPSQAGMGFLLVDYATCTLYERLEAVRRLPHKFIFTSFHNMGVTLLSGKDASLVQDVFVPDRYCNFWQEKGIRHFRELVRSLLHSPQADSTVFVLSKCTDSLELFFKEAVANGCRLTLPIERNVFCPLDTLCVWWK